MVMITTSWEIDGETVETVPEFIFGGSKITADPRDSQEFSPTPQFKSINSSVLSFLYDPTLTHIHA